MQLFFHSPVFQAFQSNSLVVPARRGLLPGALLSAVLLLGLGGCGDVMQGGER